MFLSLGWFFFVVFYSLYSFKLSDIKFPNLYTGHARDLQIFNMFYKHSAIKTSHLWVIKEQQSQATLKQRIMLNQRKNTDILINRKIKKQSSFYVLFLKWHLMEKSTDGNVSSLYFYQN